MAETATAGRRWSALVKVKPGEGRALLLAFGYFFFLLASYYVLRPVRDEMGVRSGLRNLPWLFTATFVVSLVIAPIYAGLVARMPRRVFIPVVYGFLIFNIAAFWALLSANIAPAALAMTFFVWLTVYSVFAVSVFWSFMADLFASEQAQRLYPTIAAGGSLGGFAGSATVTGLAQLIGPANLLVVAGVLLALALVCAVELDRAAGRVASRASAQAERKVGGGVLAGLTTLFRSAYLSGVALWVLLLSLGNTFAYYMQADIVGRASVDSAARTQIFGAVDLAANVLTPLIQLFIGRWVLQRVGVGPTLGIVAAVFAVGFVAMALSPTLGVLIAFQIAQRTGQFALSNPARETLFTVVDREEKYKAKNVIDNAVFRGGDVANAWLFNLLHAGAGLSLSAISLVGAPVMALWFALSLVLGRAETRRAARRPAATEGAAA
jgi:AAA family ATP:ADP antiporter